MVSKAVSLTASTSDTFLSLEEKTSVVVHKIPGFNGIGIGEGAIKVKTLPPSVVKDVEQKNICRRLAGIEPITIKVRRCILCGGAFESFGNRTCGCSSRSAGSIAGREII